jgi:hypothetical protein
MSIMDNSHLPAFEDDIFGFHALQLAAHVRLLLFARETGDKHATELILLYLTGYMQKVLLRHLSMCDTDWNNATRHLYQEYRWFDGLEADPEFPAPGLLSFRGDAYWLIGQEHPHFDPIDFEIELSPVTGDFRRYSICFGDSRPLASKSSPSDYPNVPVREWAYRFEKRMPDSSGPSAIL